MKLVYLPKYYSYLLLLPVTMFLTLIQSINTIYPLGLALCLGVGVLSLQFLIILHTCRRIDPERERPYDMKWMDVKEL
jgi:hypothetical protein